MSSLTQKFNAGMSYEKEGAFLQLSNMVVRYTENKMCLNNKMWYSNDAKTINDV